MAAEVLLQGGTVVDATGRRRADVLVADGVVVAVGESIEVPSSARVLDAGGCLVAPGLVDLHAHLRQPQDVYGNDQENGEQRAGMQIS